MDPATLLAAIGVPLVGGALAGALGYGGWRWWKATPGQRLYRAFRDTPLSTTRDAREGALVKLRGRIEAIEATLIAPLSQRTCVHYETSAGTPAGEAGRRTIAAEFLGQDFLLRDEEGTALIPMRDREVSFAQVSTQRSGTMDGPDEAMRMFLERNGESADAGVLFPRAIEYRESRLVPGQEILVIGCAHWEIDPTSESADYRAAPRRLVLREGAEGPLVVADDPEFGGASGTA